MYGDCCILVSDVTASWFHSVWRSNASNWTVPGILLPATSCVMPVCGVMVSLCVASGVSWCLVCGGLCSHLDSACSPTACGLLCGATCVVCLVCGVLISRVCGGSGILESRLTVPYNCQNRRFPKNGGPAVHPPGGIQSSHQHSKRKEATRALNKEDLLRRRACARSDHCCQANCPLLPKKGIVPI